MHSTAVHSTTPTDSAGTTMESTKMPTAHTRTAESTPAAAIPGHRVIVEPMSDRNRTVSIEMAVSNDPAVIRGSPDHDR